METKTRVDGYLSTLAQHKIDPSSLVLVLQGEEWILRREGQEDLGLGDTFQRAQQAIHALMRANEARTA